MAGDRQIHLRSPEELSPEERAELERALDSGVTELPPNEVKGFLGEKGMNLRKAEEYSPDLNAGLLQENDEGVHGLAIVLAFLIFFPIGYAMLWRDKHISQRRKLVTSVVVAVIIMGFFALAVLRG